MKSLKMMILLLVCGIGLANAQTLPATPNFLFIFIDDQAWDATSVKMLPGEDFSHTASYRMPNLDRIASQGMIFSQAYATHPKCEGSRSAFQMGRTSTSLNAVDKDADNWRAPPADSIANVLKRANPSYRAAHFGKWQWPAPQSPDAMGYDVSDGITMNADGTSQDPNDPKLTFGITRRAESFMEDQVNEGHPFYLQLSYYATHGPDQALASTLEGYSGDGAVRAAMTEDLDTGIGMLLEKLDELGITESTYVIYMSDNGMNSGILRGAKALLDEGGLRVPLVVSGPGISANVYSNVPVIAYDIYPTIIDFVAPGFALPEGVEGGSWKSVLLNGGEGEVERPIDRMVWHHDVEIVHPQTAMRKGDYKLVYYWDTRESFLHHLPTDLTESNNLAGQKPELAEEMLAELQAHVKAGIDAPRYALLQSGQHGAVDNRPPERRGMGADSNR
jgi:arylsulfatase A-like enzyme